MYIKFKKKTSGTIERLLRHGGKLIHIIRQILEK